MNSTRRSFLTRSAALTAATLAPRSPALAAPTGIRYAYAAITWGKEERQSAYDIAAAGYEGIQLRGEVFTDFQPAELRDFLAARGLVFTALSSGELSIDPAKRSETLATHVAHARFAKDA